VERAPMRPVIRNAVEDDLRALTDIYNHYIVHTSVTFDLLPFTPDERRSWFDAHGATGPYRLLVATEHEGVILGYATTSRWRPKAAYQTTVESSVYVHPSAVGRGCGRALYESLFQSIADEDLHRVVAGISLPNDASIRLHENCGFRSVGVFSGVGRKFDRYWDVAWFERCLR
jgi:phosphinothricin acetyltransferase